MNLYSRGLGGAEHPSARYKVYDKNYGSKAYDAYTKSETVISLFTLYLIPFTLYLAGGCSAPPRPPWIKNSWRFNFLTPGPQGGWDIWGGGTIG